MLHDKNGNELGAEGELSDAALEAVAAGGQKSVSSSRRKKDETAGPCSTAGGIASGVATVAGGTCSGGTCTP